MKIPRQLRKISHCHDVFRWFLLQWAAVQADEPRSSFRPMKSHRWFYQLAAPGSLAELEFVRLRLDFHRCSFVSFVKQQIGENSMLSDPLKIKWSHRGSAFSVQMTSPISSTIILGIFYHHTSWMDMLMLLAKSPGTVDASFKSMNTKHGSNGVATNSEKRSIAAKHGKWFQLESAITRIHPFNPKNGHS